jgi:glycosyltransferase involved in cell wall biosynthesis
LKSPLVSILIPVYNAEQWIAETLNSVLNQSWKNIEIIVVDDGSKDRSLDIIYQFNDPRLKIFKQENKGGSAARNMAFSKSYGEFIQYLDADDLLDKDKIERQLNAIKGNQLSLLSGPYYVFHETIKNAKLKEEIAYRNYDNSFDWVMENFQQKTMFSPNCWLVPRKLIEKAGPWNEQLTYNDDSEFFIRLALNASRITFVKDAVSYYRKENPKSVSARKDRKALQSRLLCLDLNTYYILEKKNNKEIKQIIANEYSKFVFSVFPFFKDLRSDAKEKIESLNAKTKRNFYNEKRISGKLSQIIGWKTVKWIQHSLFLIKLKLK